MPNNKFMIHVSSNLPAFHSSCKNIRDFLPAFHSSSKSIGEFLLAFHSSSIFLRLTSHFSFQWCQHGMLILHQECCTCQDGMLVLHQECCTCRILSYTHTHIAILYAIAASNCVLCKDAAALMNGIIVCLSDCLSVQEEEEEKVWDRIIPSGAWDRAIMSEVSMGQPLSCVVAAANSTTTHDKGTLHPSLMIPCTPSKFLWSFLQFQGICSDQCHFFSINFFLWSVAASGTFPQTKKNQASCEFRKLIPMHFKHNPFHAYWFAMSFKPHTRKPKLHVVGWLVEEDELSGEFNSENFWSEKLKANERLQCKLIMLISIVSYYYCSQSRSYQVHGTSMDRHCCCQDSSAENCDDGLLDYSCSLYTCSWFDDPHGLLKSPFSSQTCLTTRSSRFQKLSFPFSSLSVLFEHLFVLYACEKYPDTKICNWTGGCNCRSLTGTWRQMGLQSWSRSWRSFWQTSIPSKSP